MRIEVYDSTLRDGAQAEGISYSLEDKLLIARRLDALGVDYIEGGWPNPTNPKDLAFFQEVKKLDLKARVTAFGSTRRAGVAPEEDATLNTLLRGRDRQRLHLWQELDFARRRGAQDDASRKSKAD